MLKSGPLLPIKVPLTLSPRLNVTATVSLRSSSEEHNDITHLQKLGHVLCDEPRGRHGQRKNALAFRQVCIGVIRGVVLGATSNPNAVGLNQE